MIHSSSVLKLTQPFAIAFIFIATYIVEHIIPERKGLFNYKHDLTNILVGIGNLAIAGTGGFFLQKYLTFLQLNHLGLLYHTPYWLQIFAGLILLDLFMYWWHRANHIIPFLWQFHIYHHKDTKLNVTSALRFHVAEIIFSYAFKLPVLTLLGINADTVILYGIILFFVITLHHSNIRIGKITDRIVRILIVSPRMHRIHHSVIRHETNSNYSSVLPYWDMLFKSYRAQPDKPIEFGIQLHTTSSNSI
jgi:sterol desaturase/sphingolipid hydroxylase (fatty acid hydroxylase superfamily)